MKVLQPGEAFASVYVIERELGRGGMGVVFAARDGRSGQRVALKLLGDGAEATPEGRGRFVREAQLAARIQSDHVVRVLDVGEEAGIPWLAMELLEGQDLGALAKHRGILPVEEAVGYVLQAAVGLSHAHARGVLHRDLKPGNVFVCRRPDGSALVKLVDFGLAKQAVGERTLTRSGVALGSPKYMAPEQYRSARDVDGRADLYALGAILYRLLAGRPPHDGDTIESVLMSILTEPVAPISSMRSDVPAALEVVIGACLSPDPEHRPPRADELVRALSPFAPRAAWAEGLAAPSRPAATIPDGGSYAAPAVSGSTPLLTASLTRPTAPGAPVAPPPQRGVSGAKTATLMIFAFVIGVVVVAGGLAVAVVFVRPLSNNTPSGFSGMNALPSELSGRFDPAERIDFVRRRVAAKRPAPRLLGVNITARTHDGLLAVGTVEESVQYNFATSAPDCPWLLVNFGNGTSWESCPAGAPIQPPIPDPKCTTQSAMRALARKLGGAPMATSFNYMTTTRGPRWLVQIGQTSWTVDGATCAVALLD